MATPLPKQTAANDKLIASTPYAQLTDRQKQYADKYGVTLQQPPPPASSAPPPAPSNGTSPQLDSSGNLMPTTNVRSQSEGGFDSVAAAKAAGINLSNTPNGNGSYSIDGKVYYSDPQQQVKGGPGMPNSQGTLLAILADPYMNATAKQNAVDQFNGGSFGHYDIGGKDGPVTGSDGSIGGGTDPNAVSKTAEAKAAKAQADALAKQNAGDYLQGVLDQYGLGSLKDFAWAEIQNGRTSAEVLNDIRQTPQFTQRFPAIKQREQYNLSHPGANMPPLSPGEYVSYENSYRQLLSNAGLPKGFMDSQDTVTKLLANDVSVAEMTNRVEQARQATYEMNPEALSRLQQMHGIGPGSGALTAMFLDPTQAEPLLKRDLLAAQIGGQADRTGYLGLNNVTAQVMAQNGVSEQQAQSGFNNLQHNQPLFNALPGTQEANISQQAQLAAQFEGNAEDERLIEARRNGRLSQFADSGAGGFAGGTSGLSGLGSAPR